MVLEGAPRLAQKNDDREDCCGDGQNHPFQIVPLEPAGEVQNQYDECDNVESVKRHDAPCNFLLSIPKSRGSVTRMSWISEDFLQRMVFWRCLTKFSIAGRAYLPHRDERIVDVGSAGEILM